MDFELQLEKELKKLNKKETALFAWRCAVRALPFLGSAGHLEFWRKEVRQKYLNIVFSLLDHTLNYINPISTEIVLDAVVLASAIQARNVAPINEAALNTISALLNAAARDARSTAKNTIRAALKENLKINNIILADIKAIQARKEPPPFKSVLYGKIWHRFEKTLENEGCIYWAKLYKNIIDHNFKIDYEALKRRLNVPKEIRVQGAAAVANYLQEIEEHGVEWLNEGRIIILGDKGVGKTSLARRLINPDAPMPKEDESTAGVDTSLWQPNGMKIKIRIWDFAGHTITHSVHKFFLSERCLYLLVYDGRTESRNRLSYWLDHMKNYGGDSHVFIIINKRDQHAIQLPENTLKEKYPSIEKFFTFSIQDNRNALLAFRRKIISYILGNPTWKKQEIPKNYYKVKEELERNFSVNKKEIIQIKEFDQISRKYGINDIEQLLLDLHHLGISLWYKNMEAYKTLILNPEWISQGVYQIINWLNTNKKHAIDLNDFAFVFKSSLKRYPPEKYRFFFDLMKHYELAYQVKGKESLIVPHLLNEDRPEKLDNFPIQDSLMLRYVSEQPLPPDTISRFIVRHSEEIRNNIVWRYGVVLQNDKNTIAMVREEDRVITVTVKGPNKSNFISKLRETLNNIFNDYRSEKPELQYKVERYGLIPEGIDEKEKIIWLSEHKIKNHLKFRKPYYDDFTNRDISLDKIKDDYQIQLQFINYYISGGYNQFGGQNNRQEDHSDRSVYNFNFYDCNIELQGNLNDLAYELERNNYKEEAQKLKYVVRLLKETQKVSNKEEFIISGAAHRLKRIVYELGDKNSKLHKIVNGIQNGISIAQDIAAFYNGIAQWIGWPQVPKPFLKKG